jgi:hypothetical protein
MLDPALIAVPRPTNGKRSRSAPDTSIRQLAPAEPDGCPMDIVEEWGQQSFPASDPPANW